MNAQIGREPTYRKTVKTESKHEVTNDNGRRIIEFSEEKNMKVMSTHFKSRVTKERGWHRTANIQTR